MRKSTSVSIVIPNWNGEKLLKKHLPKVVSTKAYVNEIIIVDDASTDGSVDYIKKNYPKVRIFEHKQNRGFAASVNLGFRMATSELVCLLNNDVTPKKGFLKHALKHFRDKKVFGVSLHEDDMGYAKGVFRNGFIEHDPATSEKTADSFWVSGGSGVFRRDIWNKLRGLDSELFNPFYWEDIDLCYRAQKRGLKCLWEPKAPVSHKHESTTSKFDAKYKNRIQERNQLLFIWKNLTSSQLMKKHLVGLLKRCLRHPGYLRIVFMALADLPTVIRKRNIEQNESVISDESIFAKFN